MQMRQRRIVGWVRAPCAADVSRPAASSDRNPTTQADSSVGLRAGTANTSQSVKSRPALTQPTVRVLCAFALISISTSPLAARPPGQCRLGNQSEYRSLANGTVSDETRRDLRLRVLIDAIDDADIVFRGRLQKRWYLSDVQQTEVPAILEIYDHVSVLKGEIPRAAADGRVFMIRERACDGGCWMNALPEVMDNSEQPERVVLAKNNTLDNPSEAKDRTSNSVVYSGRIDALSGPCDPREINVAAVASLLAAPAEMDRLRRAYPPRSVEDKRRDEDLVKKFIRMP